MQYPRQCPLEWADLERLRAEGHFKPVASWDEIYGLCFDQLPEKLEMALPTGADLAILWGPTDGAWYYTVSWFGDADGDNWLDWQVDADLGASFCDGVIAGESVNLDHAE